MPNHVINRVRITGPNAGEIMKKYILTDTQQFDFELILPTPADADAFDFHCEQWGTKWNSYDLEMDDFDQFTFLTAWSTPLPIFLKLSTMEPSLIFHVDYADEDLGYNCGSYTTEAGKQIERYAFPKYSKLSFDFAQNLWGRSV